MILVTVITINGSRPSPNTASRPRRMWDAVSGSMRSVYKTLLLFELCRKFGPRDLLRHCSSALDHIFLFNILNYLFKICITFGCIVKTFYFQNNQVLPGKVSVKSDGTLQISQVFAKYYTIYSLSLNFWCWVFVLDFCGSFSNHYFPRLYKYGSKSFLVARKQKLLSRS